MRRSEGTAVKNNATFYCFKRSGKWYTTERGNVPKGVFEPYLHEGPDSPASVNTRRKLLAANGGKMPGLSGKGEEFAVVVILDEDVDFGYPIHLNPLDNDD